MTIEDRRLRERSAQRALITAAARQVAESEGWDAVTTRRLSAEIEYSQPVLYKHFASLDDLFEAVALEGFDELAEALRAARAVAEPQQQLGVVAAAYSGYAAEHPALYDAMFTRQSRLPFGADDRPAALSASYGEIRAAVEPVAAGRDVETLTEVLWAGMHGLVTLGRGGRLRPGIDDERLALLVATTGASAAPIP